MGKIEGKSSYEAGLIMVLGVSMGLSLEVLDGKTSARDGIREHYERLQGDGLSEEDLRIDIPICAKARDDATKYSPDTFGLYKIGKRSVCGEVQDCIRGKIAGSMEHADIVDLCVENRGMDPNESGLNGALNRMGIQVVIPIVDFMAHANDYLPDWVKPD